MWIETTADFDWRPDFNSTVELKAGARYGVTEACAAAAIAAGGASEIPTPNRDLGAVLAVDPFFKGELPDGPGRSVPAGAELAG